MPAPGKGGEVKDRAVEGGEVKDRAVASVLPVKESFSLSLADFRAVASVPSGPKCFSLSLIDFLFSDIIVFQEPE